MEWNGLSLELQIFYATNRMKHPEKPPFAKKT